jgi:hypothetical protein
MALLAGALLDLGVMPEISHLVGIVKTIAPLGRPHFAEV